MRSPRGEERGNAASRTTTPVMRAPDAAQREAVRCWSGVHWALRIVVGPGSAVHRKDAAQRPRRIALVSQDEGFWRLFRDGRGRPTRVLDQRPWRVQGFSRFVLTLLLFCKSGCRVFSLCLKRVPTEQTHDF